MHFLLASYIADIPEVEGLLGVKRGNKTFSSCHICYARREQFPSYRQYLKRSTMATVQLVKSLHYNDGRFEEEEALRQNLMLPVLPVLSSFPFVGIHKSVELYSILRVDSMHVRPLGVSKMLKECLTNTLGDDTITTDVFKNAKGEAKSYKQIKGNFLHVLNAFLKETESISSAFGLTIDFRKGDDFGSHTVFF